MIIEGNEQTEYNGYLYKPRANSNEQFVIHFRDFLKGTKEAITLRLHTLYLPDIAIFEGFEYDGKSKLFKVNPEFFRCHDKVDGSYQGWIGGWERSVKPNLVCVGERKFAADKLQLMLSLGREYMGVFREHGNALERMRVMTEALENERTKLRSNWSLACEFGGNK